MKDKELSSYFGAVFAEQLQALFAEDTPEKRLDAVTQEYRQNLRLHMKNFMRQPDLGKVYKQGMADNRKGIKRLELAVAANKANKGKKPNLPEQEARVMKEATMSDHTQHPMHQTLTDAGYKFDHTHKSPMLRSVYLGKAMRVGTTHQHIYEHPSADTAEKRFISLNHHVPKSKKTPETHDWSHPYANNKLGGNDVETLQRHIKS